VGCIVLEKIAKLIFRDENKELIISSFFAFAIRILGALSAFLATFFIAKFLGAEESGYYFLAFSVVTVLAVFSGVGLENTVLRYIGSDSAYSASVFQKSLIIVLVVSSLSAGGIYFSAYHVATVIFSKPALHPVLQSMSVGVIGLTVLTVASMALQGLRRIPMSIWILNISVNLFLVAYVYSADISLATYLASAYSVSAILTAIFGVVLFWYFKPRIVGSFVSWKTVFSSCMPLWVVAIMTQLAQWSGQFFAGIYVGSDLVALLAVAQRTAMLSSFVLVAVNLVVAPQFAALYRQGDMLSLEILAIKSVKLISVLALPLIGMMLIFPSFIMGLFGSEYVAGVPLLRILAIGQFVNAITGSVGFLLMMSGYERDMRNLMMISGCFALSLTWLLTANYGIIGAAVSTAVVVAAQNLMAVYFVKKRLGFNTLAVWR
jgi:O-antigen/teichoic acid export membrane protein